MPEYLAIASALAKVCLGYTQCLGAIIRFPLVAWPAAFTAFIEVLDVFNLEIFAIVPAECIAGKRLGFYLEMAATSSMPPLCVAVVAFSVWLVDRIDVRVQTREPFESWQAYRAHLLMRLFDPKCCKLLMSACKASNPRSARGRCDTWLPCSPSHLG